MIQINVVARIAGDKNSFIDIIYLMHRIKQSGMNDVKVLFIGGLHDTVVYHNATRLSELLGVSDRVGFTLKSIPLAQLPQEVKDGYFLHFSVGNFIGYSAIETVNMGFKSIFYNADPALEAGMTDSICFCRNMDHFIELIRLLSTDRANTDAAIIAGNKAAKAKINLTEDDKIKLLSILVPQK